MDAWTVQPIHPHATHALRRRVLRPHQPLSEMAYPGDDAPETIHLGIIDSAADAASGGGVVGITSLYRGPCPTTPQPGDWRLRGVAVDPASQKRGLGTRLVTAGLDAVRRRDGRRVWCNARTPACAFYERLGFARTGGPFDLPGIGEHCIMRIAVEPRHR